MDKRIESFSRIAAIALLAAGCLYVLKPFLGAILFAAVVGISSWPLYQRLLARLGGRRTLAALTMTLSLAVLVLLPLTLLAYSLTDNIGQLLEQLRLALDQHRFTTPSWLKAIPLLGEVLDGYLRRLSGNHDELVALAQSMVEPARHVLASGALMLGSGVVQVGLAAFVSFFFYRDGEQFKSGAQAIMQRLIGSSAAKVTRIVVATVRSVMFGLLGTALMQALVAAAGLAIAGVPAVPLLSVATFLLSLLPIGPPIVWVGAALWLFAQDQVGWGIFMLGWGALMISGVDNFVRPMLISRGSSLPFLLVLLGVTGGVLVFGFVGLFIGPVLLAVGFSLLRDWVSNPREH
jgi:predicted PurR-regulated permease PerM